MATPNFHRLVNDIRAWSNRDADVLPDEIIEDAISFTSDDSYHRLMIPPLESTFTYDPLTSDDITITNGVRTIELAVPSDLVQFIHLRTTGNRGCVFNEKTDVRTFHDMTADTYFDNYWARQGNNILVAGHLQNDDVFELFYYRRLPATNAVYRVNQANIDAGVVTHMTTQPTYVSDYPIVSLRGEDDPDAVDASTVGPFNDINGDEQTTGWWVPQEIPHWLKDENRKILLFGGLSYVGKYLMDDMIVQYHQGQYAAEIEAVNREEKMRKSSGGNVQMHFNGRGLI